MKHRYILSSLSTNQRAGSPVFSQSEARKAAQSILQERFSISAQTYKFRIELYMNTGVKQTDSKPIYSVNGINIKGTRKYFVRTNFVQWILS